MVFIVGSRGTKKGSRVEGGRGGLVPPLLTERSSNIWLTHPADNRQVLFSHCRKGRTQNIKQGKSQQKIYPSFLKISTERFQLGENIKMPVVLIAIHVGEITTCWTAVSVVISCVDCRGTICKAVFLGNKNIEQTGNLYPLNVTYFTSFSTLKHCRGWFCKCH